MDSARLHDKIEQTVKSGLHHEAHEGHKGF
jgi:hypothetical protein